MKILLKNYSRIFDNDRTLNYLQASKERMVKAVSCVAIHSLINLEIQGDFRLVSVIRVMNE
jgi:hypothetical protein